MPDILIIDYGSGNLRSVAKAFEKVGAQVEVSCDAQKLDASARIVLPGVGAFGDCMKGLTALPGMMDALQRNVRECKKPFLGICVGMQLLFQCGHEYGVHEGLGWLEGEVVSLDKTYSVLGTRYSEKNTEYASPSTKYALKIPHMGWNELAPSRAHPLLAGIHNGDHAYFVHSFHATAREEDTLATTDYGQNIVAIVAKDNIMGTQFHPEKSQEVGLKLLNNFLSM